MEIRKKALQHNPFAGVDHEEVGQILVPRFDTEDILNKIRSRNELLIELIGKQGRGKTTHLTFLHQQLEKTPIFYLHAGANDYQKILADKSEVVFIDSIHHLNIYQRLQVFRAKKIVIFTTHFTRKYEGLAVRKPTKQIRFEGIDKTLLRALVTKRLQLTSSKSGKELIVSDFELEQLIAQYGDNYRGIVNHLYDKFQDYE